MCCLLHPWLIVQHVLVKEYWRDWRRRCLCNRVDGSHVVTVVTQVVFIVVCVCFCSAQLSLYSVDTKNTSNDPSRIVPAVGSFRVVFLKFLYAVLEPSLFWCCSLCRSVWRVFPTRLPVMYSAPVCRLFPIFCCSCRVRKCRFPFRLTAPPTNWARWTTRTSEASVVANSTTMTMAKT